jgi:hypothetical protein
MGNVRLRTQTLIGLRLIVDNEGERGVRALPAPDTFRQILG